MRWKPWLRRKHMLDSATLASLAATHARSTPFYVFDEDAVISRVRTLQGKLPPNAGLCFAIKANPFLLPALKDLDILFEVCSPGELSICEDYGVPPQKIVFSGVCKTRQDIDRAVALGVKTVTLESPLHCDMLLDSLQASGKTQEVIVRLTSACQFGMSKEDVVSCVKKIAASPLATLRGIHFFTGTQKKFSKVEKETAEIQAFCDTLKAQTGVDFPCIEYGAGLAYDYFSSGKGEPYEDFDRLCGCLKDTCYEWTIELGRFIAAPCGTYVTTIMDSKRDGENRYLIVDGGIHHIQYYGQMMGMKLPPVTHLRVAKSPSNDSAYIPARSEQTEAAYTVCGSLCTLSDVILRSIKLSAPQIGDLLVFSDIGAYSVTEGIYLLLSHPLPRIFMYSQNAGLREVRGAFETYTLNH